MAIQHESIVKSGSVYYLNPEKIQIEEGWNPREDFGDIESLKKSVHENGVLVPIRVRKSDNNIYLTDGERRLRAVLLLSKEIGEIVSIPAIVDTKKETDSERLFKTLVTNSGKLLSYFEEARAFKRFINWGIKQSDIAKRIGKSGSYVSQRIKLVDQATPELLEEIKNDHITLQSALDIIAVSESEKEQKEILADQLKFQTNEKKENNKRKGKSPNLSDKKFNLSASSLKKSSDKSGRLSEDEINWQVRIASQLGLSGVVKGLKIALGTEPQITASDDFGNKEESSNIVKSFRFDN